MTKQIAVVTVLIMLSGCAPLVYVKTPDRMIHIDAELLKHSDYVDIVSEDGVFSYISYLKEEDLIEDRRKSSCNHIVENPTAPSIGVWIWNYKKVIGREKDVTEKLLKYNIKRAYIQIGTDLEELKPFLKEAKAKGIEVFGLDGAPEHIDNYRILLEGAKRIRQFNQANRDLAFEGLQVDVEPYLKKDFNLKKEYYLRQYLKMAQDLRKAARKDIKLSFALPFWFDKFIIDGKPLSFYIIDIADEVVVMSYRTAYNEIVESAYNELCYGSSTDKPVFLGLEINRLPDEQHLVMNKNDLVRHLHTNESSAVLLLDPYSKPPVFRRYEVKSENMTFFKKRWMLQSILSKTPPFKGFSGYIIHSYEGMDE